VFNYFGSRLDKPEGFLEIFLLLGTVLIVVSSFIVLISLIYLIYESITVHLLMPSSFKYGKLVLKTSQSIPLNRASIQIGQVHHIQNGKFKFISARECFFCSKYKVCEIPVGFAIKGGIRWQDDIAEVEGRIPLGPSLLIGVGLVAGTVVGLMGIVSKWSDPSILVFILFMLFVWAFFGVISFSTIRTGVSSAHAIINEIKEYVAYRVE